MLELLVLVAIALFGLSVPIMLYGEIEARRNKRLEEYELKLLARIWTSRFSEKMPITPLLVTMEEHYAEYISPSNLPFVVSVSTSYIRGVDHEIAKPPFAPMTFEGLS